MDRLFYSLYAGFGFCPLEHFKKMTYNKNKIFNMDRTHLLFDEVYIVGAGLGKRVSKYTMGNTLPKALMSIGGETMFDRQIGELTKYSNKIYYICRPCHMAMLADRVNMLSVLHDRPSIKKTVKLFAYGGEPGTYETLRRITRIYHNYTYRHKAGDKTLVMWSDISPVDYKEALGGLSGQLGALKKYTGYRIIPTCVVARDTAREHGFDVVKRERPILGEYRGCVNRPPLAADKIIRAENNKGNVAGMYGFLSFHSIFDYGPGVSAVKTDLAGCLDYRADEIVMSTSAYGFLDIGDGKKYKKTLKNVKNNSRYFNKVDVGDNSVTKTAVFKNGKNLLQKEQLFYGKVSDKSIIPHILKTGRGDGTKDTGPYITMAKITLPTVREHQNSRISAAGDPDAAYYRSLVSAFEKNIGKLHGPPSYAHFHSTPDAQLEYIHEPLARLADVRPLLDALGRPGIDVKSCNNLPIVNEDIVFNRLIGYLKGVTIKKGFIHGDTNTDNVFFDEKTKGMFFIDPRGYFGGSTPGQGAYGDVAYDHAKFLYGLTGYGEFNAIKVFAPAFEQKTGALSFKLGGGDALLDALASDVYVKILVGIIWLKLTSYIKNSPTKSIFAYYYGLGLLNKYLP